MQRLESLDIFRGLTISLMILVNNPGSWASVYAPFLHADWHGCTPTDLVFPFFLFIMGVAIPLALGKRLNQGASHSEIGLKILKRSLIIFFIGIFLAGFPYFNFNTLRIPGVLQRIALVYAVCSLLFLYLNQKQIIISGFLFLLLYWGLMTLVPVPGVGTPNLQPDTNLGAWLDRLLLDGHLWAQSKTWDPEGLLSTLPAITNGIAGMLVGNWLKSAHQLPHKLAGLMVFGILLSGWGLFWDYSFPINKKIWTSSYAVYTSGLAMCCLGVVIWFVDLQGRKKWAQPFKWFGMNALILYAGSSFLAKVLDMIKVESKVGESLSLKAWFYQHGLASWMDPFTASLVFALLFAFLFLLLAWWLYQKKIFIKV